MASQNPPGKIGKIERVFLEKAPFTLSYRISSNMLRDLEAVHRDHPLTMSTIYLDENPLYHDLLVTLRYWLLKSTHTEKRFLSISVPDTWWDHLKKDLLQSEVGWKVWLAKRFSPPQYTSEHREYDYLTRVCPHNNTYFSEDRKHIDFLTWEDADDRLA